MSYDRIVCSSQYGGLPQQADLARVFYGDMIANVKSVSELYGTEGKYEDLQDVLIAARDKSISSDSPVYIYCDKESFYSIVSHWLKVALPYSNEDSAWRFVWSHLFKERNFVNSRLSATSRFASDLSFVDETMFRSAWQSVVETDRDWVDFMQDIETLRVEFLLAGYFYDGRYADKLASSMTPLVRKDLEGLLYELKETMLVHMQRPIFQEMLGTDKIYTLDNLEEMVDDNSPLVQVMFDPLIWGAEKTSMYAASSKGTISLSQITDEQIELLKEFSDVTGKIWEENKWVTIQRSEIDKFDMIKMFRKGSLDIDDVNTIINYEIDGMEHVAGSFYSIDLRTVNTYFVDWILLNKDDTDAMKPYAIILN